MIKRDREKSAMTPLLHVSLFERKESVSFINEKTANRDLMSYLQSVTEPLVDSIYRE